MEETKKFPDQITELIDKIQFQVQYVDYQEDQWTVPILMTQDRLHKSFHDHSVRRIKFHLSDSVEWIYDLKDEFDPKSVQITINELWAIKK